MKPRKSEEAAREINEIINEINIITQSIIIQSNQVIEELEVQKIIKNPEIQQTSTSDPNKSPPKEDPALTELKKNIKELNSPNMSNEDKANKIGTIVKQIETLTSEATGTKISDSIDQILLEQKRLSTSINQLKTKTAEVDKRMSQKNEIGTFGKIKDSFHAVRKTVMNALTKPKEEKKDNQEKDDYRRKP